MRIRDLIDKLREFDELSYVFVETFRGKDRAIVEVNKRVSQGVVVIKLGSRDKEVFE